MAHEFIGSQISLTSRANIRYVGILREIDPQASTVSLEQVKSMGTEDRPGLNGIPYPPSDDIYPFIVFRAADVKDLQVMSRPAAPIAQPEGLPADPAIMSSAPSTQSTSKTQPPPHQHQQNSAPPQQQQHRNFNQHGPGGFQGGNGTPYGPPPPGWSPYGPPPVLGGPGFAPPPPAQQQPPPPGGRGPLPTPPSGGRQGTPRAPPSAAPSPAPLTGAKSVGAGGVGLGPAPGAAAKEGFRKPSGPRPPAPAAEKLPSPQPPKATIPPPAAVHSTVAAPAVAVAAAKEKSVFSTVPTAMEMLTQSIASMPTAKASGGGGGSKSRSQQQRQPQQHNSTGAAPHPARGSQQRPGAAQAQAQAQAQVQAQHPAQKLQVTVDVKSEFDFVKSNAAFTKPAVVSPTGDEVVIPVAQGGTDFYDKKKSFFDDISSEVKERSEASTTVGGGQRGRVKGRGGRFFDRSAERQKNVDTFGDAAVSAGFGALGSGYNGYGRRGGARAGAGAVPGGQRGRGRSGRGRARGGQPPAINGGA